MIGLTFVGRALRELDSSRELIRVGQDSGPLGFTFVEGALREIVQSSQARFGDKQARDYLAAAYLGIFHTPGSLNALQIAQGVSRGESFYGQATYKNLADGSSYTNTNNWTAQQCGSMRPPCFDPCFEATDTRANGDKYQACFRRFPTPEAGAAAFLHTLYEQRPEVLAAANAGDVDLVAERMRASKYFELPLARYQKALNTNVDKVAKALGEPRATPASGGRRVWPWLLGGLIGTVVVVRVIQP